MPTKPDSRSKLFAPLLKRFNIKRDKMKLIVVEKWTTCKHYFYDFEKPTNLNNFVILSPVVWRSNRG